MATPYRSTVVYDPDALHDFLVGVRGKEERKAAFNAVDKLRRVGESLAPPHMKSLQGEANLNELRPRQGRSPTRLIYRRVGDVYVVLAEGGLREEEARRPGARAAVRLSLPACDKTFVIISPRHRPTSQTRHDRAPSSK